MNCNHTDTCDNYHLYDGFSNPTCSKNSNYIDNITNSHYSYSCIGSSDFNYSSDCNNAKSSIEFYGSKDSLNFINSNNSNNCKILITLVIAIVLIILVILKTLIISIILKF